MVESVPLKWPRLGVYAITWALAIVSIGAAINSFTKANKDKDLAESLGPTLPIPDIAISVDIHDIIRAGGVMLAGEILTSLTAFLCIVSLLFSFGTHSRTHIASSIFWAFDLLWLFGSAVATTVYARQRSATLSAYQNGVKLPDSLVQALASASGMNSAYWSHGYTRFLAIAPWPLILFTAISLALSVLAHGRQRRLASDTKV